MEGLKPPFHGGSWKGEQFGPGESRLLSSVVGNRSINFEKRTCEVGSCAGTLRTDTRGAPLASFGLKRSLAFCRGRYCGSGSAESVTPRKRKTGAVAPVLGCYRLSDWRYGRRFSQWKIHVQALFLGTACACFRTRPTFSTDRCSFLGGFTQCAQHVGLIVTRQPLERHANVLPIGLE